MEHSYDSHFQHMVVSCQEFYSGIRWLTFDEFRVYRRERMWHIVDVRSEAERAISIIPGSISWDAYRNHFDEYREHPVLVYCTVGCRSAGYAQTLQEEKVEVYNLWGGVIEWAQHGGTFATEAGVPTKKVHTHGKRWNLLPPAYKAVW